MVIVFKTPSRISWVEGNNDFAYIAAADAGAVLSTALSYQLAPGATDYFVIDSITGVVRLRPGVTLDYEKERNVTFSVIATTADGTSVSQLVSVQVLNTDEPPVLTAPAGIKLFAGGAGDDLFTVAAFDPEGGPLKYSLSGDPIFTFDSARQMVGLVSTLPAGYSIDYSGNVSYNLVLTITDSTNHITVKNLQFYLADKNQTDGVVWHQFADKPYTLAEDTTQVVQELWASKQGGRVISGAGSTGFELLGSDKDFFSINDNNQLLLLTTANYENNSHSPLYVVTVLAHGDSGVTGQQIISINIYDKDDAVQFADRSFTRTLQEIETVNAGVGVYTASAMDGDKAGSFTYMLNDPNGYLTIDSAGVVRFQKAFDVDAWGYRFADVTPIADANKIILTDPSMVQNITRNDLTSKNFIVLRNDTATLQAFKAKFGLTPVIAQTQYRAPAQVFYTATVWVASNNARLNNATYASQMLVLTINNTPAEQEMIWHNTGSIALNVGYDNTKANSLLLADLSAEKARDTTKIWYEMDNFGDGGALPFSIDRLTGQLLLRASAINSSSFHGYSLLITATSGTVNYSSSISRLITVKLENLNDPALRTLVAIATNLKTETVENNAANLAVADFSINDGRTLNVALVAGLDSANFRISGTQLQFVSSIDFENRAGHSPFYSVVVQFTAGSMTQTRLQILTIDNINDNATSWSANPSSINITENNATGVSVATFTASDADGQGVSYSLGGIDSQPL